LKVTDPIGNAVDLGDWFANGSRDGALSAGLPAPDRYNLSFPLADPGSAALMARAAFGLDLMVRVAIFGDDSSADPSNVLRSHVAVCRFLDLDAEDVAGLDLRPDFAVALDRMTWCVWGLTRPASPDELVQLQEDLRDGFDGDPDWDASPVELVPLPGVLYPVGNAEVEAVELEVPA